MDILIGIIKQAILSEPESVARIVQVFATFESAPLQQQLTDLAIGYDKEMEGGGELDIRCRRKKREEKSLPVVIANIYYSLLDHLIAFNDIVTSEIYKTGSPITI